MKIHGDDALVNIGSMCANQAIKATDQDSLPVSPFAPLTCIMTAA
jgi:hypothetical protein